MSATNVKIKIDKTGSNEKYLLESMHIAVVVNIKQYRYE